MRRALDLEPEASDKGAVETAPTQGDGAQAEAPRLPRTFGHYVLFDLIGRGGMAEIYLARAKTQEAGGARLVVVKQILPELSANAKFADALVQEAKLAARLSHANVAQVFDLGREGRDQRLFIAMEYVEGLDLNELLRKCARTKVPLPIEFALLVIMEVLRGLDYAHRRTDDAGRPLGIVHRDVSPSNVLVSVEGEVKLCDFGIARANDVAERAGARDAFAPDAIQGKAGYMSPEHARGEPLDGRADVFAAGVILWELLAGRRMYKADKERGESLLALARRGEVPELPERGLPFEDEIRGIVFKALAIDREQRFVTAAAMLDALQRYVARARLVASPIRLGDWLTEHFGNELVATRRARERAVKALEAGPAAAVTPVTSTAEQPSSAPIRPVSLWPPAAPPTPEGDVAIPKPPGAPAIVAAPLDAAANGSPAPKSRVGTIVVAIAAVLLVVALVLALVAR
ncbi:MAG: protein kinase [Deltaproteobacteria bacterium]|nr:protein kinase [Deltaproteobacteria bacterium]